jgi:putative nucleotidyltransferase with HDIG domain
MLQLACRRSFVSQRLIPQTEIRLSEIISAFSVALDITQGHPQGHSMRTGLIGMRLADQIGLSAVDRLALFYALLLKDLGCSSNAAKIAYLFGSDDQAVKHATRMIDWTRPVERLRHCWSNCRPTGTTWQRVRQAAELVLLNSEELHNISELRCNRGATIARLLRLPESTAQAIYHLDEHWDGRGTPGGLSGHAIPLLSRICCLAQTVEVFFTAYGFPAALDVAQGRRGNWFDPDLVDALLAVRNDADFWSRLSRPMLAEDLKHWEPQDAVQWTDDDCLDRVAEAFAMVVDAKSPWTFQHSSRVAAIAVGTATQMGCCSEVQRDIRRAALLHDIGKLGVSNAILDKPGRPTAEELRQIRKHPEYTREILMQVAAFQDLADVAGAHHERLDGGGYHRQLRESELPWAARVLAAADICEAMTAKRPYRDAMTWEQTYAIMARDAGRGVDAECLQALATWYEGAEFASRVEDQLTQVDQMVCSLT